MTLCVRGSWLPDDIGRLPCGRHESAWIGETAVACWVGAEESSQWSHLPMTDLVDRIAGTRTRVEASGTLVRRPWDLVDRNAEQLRRDYQNAGPKRPYRPRHGVEVLGATSLLSVSAGADIEPFVVIDVRNGPVSIDAGAQIRAFTRLEGPCHIGRETQVFRGQISAGSTIGPVCRIGGEVENSIVHGWANKYHDGFLGHSYICPWVNIGAQSGTSDLKFDYSPVRVPLSGEMIETGRSKVGSFIGDHTKTAVNSLFDTGTSVGVMSLVLPDGDLIPRHIPSFARYWRGELSECPDPETLLQIARTAMSRRGRDFTAAQEMLFRVLFDRTSEERRRAIERRRPGLRIHPSVPLLRLPAPQVRSTPQSPGRVAERAVHLGVLRGSAPHPGHSGRY
jgi:UDP-N-acetylglucosamine diphosphorylase/glucosamine-1-phosphate N-acetyltransferase